MKMCKSLEKIFGKSGSIKAENYNLTRKAAINIKVDFSGKEKFFFQLTLNYKLTKLRENSGKVQKALVYKKKQIIS